MPATPKVKINPSVLAWAREISGYEIETIAKRVGVTPEKFRSWEASESEPTLAQLRSLSGLFRRTVASFLLPAVPTSDLPRLSDFRSATGGRISPELRREMRKAASRRKVFLELSGAPDRSVPVSETDLAGSPEQIAASIRESLGISLQHQERAANGAASLRLWIRAVENQGILVYQMSRIPLSECRGFSQFEPIFPVIVLNGADSPEARSFTLVHELIHVLLRSGSICTLRSRGGVESRCNQLAAEILMPGEQFLLSLGDEDPVESIPRLAKTFNVSLEATAIRLRTLRKISEDQLQEIRDRILEAILARKQAEREESGGDGPPHFQTHLRNLGDTYVATVLDAYHDKRITLADAAHFLEAKISTIDKMEAALVRRKRFM